MNRVSLIPIEKGFGKTQINVVIFRRDSISTFEDTQVVSYYDAQKLVAFAQRKLNSSLWEITRLKHRGKVLDAHNCISIIHDSLGYLHVSYDHHNHPLRYNKSVYPQSIDFTQNLPMTGINEQKVCYPQFYRNSKGIIFFFFRDGKSGNGNLNLKRYDPENNIWEDVQTNLIDGQNVRNAYWQIWIDENDIIHLSWVWRETGNATTNHDICYTKSVDGGETWLKSNNEPQNIPITQSNADYAVKISQNSALLNQTSMTTDSDGDPFIAALWKPKDEDNPQYMIVYFKEGKWLQKKVWHNPDYFDLDGRGTLQFPLSRPLIMIDKQDHAYIVFRAKSRNYVVSIAAIRNISQKNWSITDLTDFPSYSWEPTMDSTLWKRENILNLLIQKTGYQRIKEFRTPKPQMLYILECKPLDFLLTSQ